MVLDGADLSAARLQRLSVVDVRMRGGSLANAAGRGALGPRRAVGVRLTGLDLPEADLRTSSCATAAPTDAFARSRLERVWFERCELRADFLDADLREVRFVDCDLSRTDFRGARLQSCELRGVRLDGMRAWSGCAAAMPMLDVIGNAATLATASGCACSTTEAQYRSAGARSRNMCSSGRGGLREPEAAVQLVRVGRREVPAAQPLQLRVREDALHERDAEAPPPVRGQDEDVAEVREDGAVAHDAGEAGLRAVGVVEAERQRALDGALDDLGRHPLRPVRPAEEPGDDGQVEPTAVGRDLEAALERPLHGVRPPGGRPSSRRPPTAAR